MHQKVVHDGYVICRQLTVFILFNMKLMHRLSFKGWGVHIRESPHGIVIWKEIFDTTNHIVKCFYELPMPHCILEISSYPYVQLKTLNLKTS